MDTKGPPIEKEKKHLFQTPSRIAWKQVESQSDAQAVANLANAYAKFGFASPAAPDATRAPARA